MEFKSIHKKMYTKWTCCNAINLSTQNTATSFYGYFDSVKRNPPICPLKTLIQQWLCLLNYHTVITVFKIFHNHLLWLYLPKKGNKNIPNYLPTVKNIYESRLTANLQFSKVSPTHLSIVFAPSPLNLQEIHNISCDQQVTYLFIYFLC